MPVCPTLSDGTDRERLWTRLTLGKKHDYPPRSEKRGDRGLSAAARLRLLSPAFTSPDLVSSRAATSQSCQFSGSRWIACWIDRRAEPSRPDDSSTSASWR